jgi:hypothetical protein
MADAGGVSAGSDPWMKPPGSLRLIIPFLPPTSNNIYVMDWRRKRIFKSRQADAFASRFSQEVVPVYLPWISQMVGADQDPNVVYSIFTDFYFPRWEVESKGWFNKKRSAKSRYKKMDTGNRLKLLHDCAASALAIDDAHFFGIGARKLVAETFGVEPQVHIFLTKVDPANFGIP